jgi:hypothetical protein
MIKIIIGAVGMYIYLKHPEYIQYTLSHTKDAVIYALDWVSGHLKS